MHLEHVVLSGGEHSIKTLQDYHRQDHVAVLAAHIEVAEHVVGDSPEEVCDPVDVLVVAHVTPYLETGYRTRHFSQILPGRVFRVPFTYLRTSKRQNIMRLLDKQNQLLQLEDHLFQLKNHLGCQFSLLILLKINDRM